MCCWEVAAEHGVGNAVEEGENDVNEGENEWGLEEVLTERTRATAKTKASAKGKAKANNSPLTTAQTKCNSLRDLCYKRMIQAQDIVEKLSGETLEQTRVDQLTKIACALKAEIDKLQTTKMKATSADQIMKVCGKASATV